LEQQHGAIDVGESLLELIATWFIRATERVLRRDFVRDYMPTTDAVRSVRGSIHALSTARNYYGGRLEFQCSFEEFGYDSDLNRAIRAAARIVAANPQLLWTTRRRARAILARMDEVGDFDATRPWPKLDRRTKHYKDSLSLAAHLLRSDNRDLRHGGADAWTFLIKTPEMIETAIRSILQEAFHGVHKSALQLANSAMTLNPDLVIGAREAVADVKYKLSRRDWDRPDLYQLVAFATGYQTQDAALIDFSTGGADRETVSIGDITVRNVAWPADAALSASDAQARFLGDFAAWRKQCVSTTNAVVA
jgi:5-methylcytosine-specific restriction endonuclease McrBC regulatory subunit McrC